MTESQFTTQVTNPIPGGDVDPAYAAAYPPTVPVPADLPPAGHAPHPEMIDRLENIERKIDHLLRSRVDLLSKIDHLLEHAHQPLEGHITLHPPAKVPAGLEDEEWDGDPNCEDCIPDPDLI